MRTRVTRPIPAASASCCWVMPACLRRSRTRFPMRLLPRDAAASDCSRYAGSQ